MNKTNSATESDNWAKYSISLIRSEFLACLCAYLCATAVATTGRQRSLGGFPHERLPWEPPQRAASPLRLNFNPQIATNLRKAVLSCQAASALNELTTIASASSLSNGSLVNSLPFPYSDCYDEHK